MRRSAAMWIFVVALVAAACAGSTDREGTVVVEFRVAETQAGDGLTEMTFTGWGVEETFYLHDEVSLTDADIASASVITHRSHPAVEVIFSEGGRQRFEEVTRDNVGKHLAMVVDGRLACAPLIRAPIGQGKAIIEGDFTEDEARRIADGLGVDR